MPKWIVTMREDGDDPRDKTRQTIDAASLEVNAAGTLIYKRVDRGDGRVHPWLVINARAYREAKLVED